ncbi:MAG: T9SS type A sorting domain-containing protein [Chlorobi bacterium]|nr:T9SS type A sorting domain-containing protein [Chlorobiota bacterium]
MKTLITIIFFIISNSVLFAQLKTEAYFGMSNRMDYAEGLIEYYDGGYYFLGGYEYEKGWTIKTDINLEHLWDFTFEFPSVPVYVKGSVKDTAGNIYLCGSVDSWPFVAKMNSCGEKLWCKVLKYENEFNYGYSKDIIITSNNNIVILVKYDSEDEINVIHLISLYENGDVLWIKPYASKNDYPWIAEPNGYSLKEINNNYYISGKCYWPYPDDTTHWFLRPLFIGIDSLFNEKWILPFYPLDSIYGKAYKTIPLNDSIFMGVGIRRLAESKDHSLLMFYNKSGEEVGYREITNSQIGPNINSNEIRDIQRINDTLFMTASFFGLDNSENPAGEFVIDTAANLYNFESRPNTYIPKLIKTSDNNYIIANSIDENKGDKDIYVYKIDENLNDVPFDPTPHVYDSLCPGGIQSGNIDLSDCFVWTNIGDAPGPAEYYESIKQIPIKAYPNPVSDGSITFEFENTEHHNNMELRCLDIYGKEIFSTKVYRYQTEAVVDISKIKRGMYVAVIYSNGFPVGKCKFVVQ